MRGARRNLLCLLWLTAACLPPAGPAFAQALKEQLKQSGPSPLVIHSRTLEVDDSAGTVLFSGEVNAQKDDFVMTCRTMTVFYEKAPEEKTSSTADGEAGTQTRIQKIVARGGVIIQRAEGGTATAEEAVYYQQDEKVVLTGRPIVKQGRDFVEGDRITILLKENRSIVESSGDSRVKAVIFQDGEKEKPL